MKKVLVAVDGSEPSLRAAKLAQDVAKGCGASVTLVYVVPPFLPAPEVPYAMVQDVFDAEQRRGDQLLEQAMHEIDTSTVSVSCAKLDGTAADRIADYAEEGDFDLVVVGSRGKNAVARLFLGSVADRTVHICKKPVMVVH